MTRHLATFLALAVAACGGSSGSPPPSASPPPPPPPGPIGLDARPSNLTCVAPARPPVNANIAAEQQFANLGFSEPLGMLQAPGDSTRWFVLEKTGRVRVFSNDPNTTSFLPDFIDISQYTILNTEFEGGLLGMAFHPDYENNRQVFLSWTEGTPMTSVIGRFVANADGQTLDPGSRTDILLLQQDFPYHNGGQITFGPDGYLYIAFGDGGEYFLNRSQETQNLHGSILRIDVDGGAPYAIPADNPFAGNPTCPADPDNMTADCPEIFAWGFRNPWRFSFDSATGDLWVGDVGMASFEEIDLVERGGNYGWPCREGANDFPSAPASCATASNLIDPIHQYPRSQGVAVTGGYVYRGSQLPDLHGSYVFTDWGSSDVWRLVDDGQGGLTDELLLDLNFGLASFGEAADKELYLVNTNGLIYRIVAGPGGPTPPPIPDRLSNTGCMQTNDASQPGDGLIPYTVTAPFWSDGADKTRWMAIPNGTGIDVGADGNFSFPLGSVIVKQFHLANQLIETRLLMRHPNGVWAGYSYRWDDQLGDGVLVSGGSVENIQGQDWVFPSSTQCINCHTQAAGNTLGLEALQLNGDFTYPSTGRTANQLRTLDGILALNQPIGDPANLDSLVNPSDQTASLAERARSYLHTNCSQCHRPGGPTPTTMDLRFDTALNQTAACDRQPQNGDLGLGPTARIIAPGAASRSVLVERMSRRDVNGMPPLASNLVDTASVALIESWIDSLASCI